MWEKHIQVNSLTDQWTPKRVKHIGSLCIAYISISIIRTLLMRKRFLSFIWLDLSIQEPEAIKEVYWSWSLYTFQVSALSEASSLCCLLDRSFSLKYNAKTKPSAIPTNMGGWSKETKKYIWEVTLEPLHYADVSRNIFKYCSFNNPHLVN